MRFRKNGNLGKTCNVLSSHGFLHESWPRELRAPDQSIVHRGASLDGDASELRLEQIDLCPGGKIFLELFCLQVEKQGSLISFFSSWSRVHKSWLH